MSQKKDDIKRSPDPEKPYFFQIENEFIDSGCFRKLNKFHPSIAAVYFVLKRYKNFKTGWSCPTIERIVKNSGYSRTRVCKATKALELIGLIEKKQAGKEFNFRMNYKIRKHDRKGFEKIADTSTSVLEQCYKKHTSTTRLEQWQKKKPKNSDRSTCVEKSATLVQAGETPTLVQAGETRKILKEKKITRRRTKKYIQQSSPPKNQKTKKRKPKITAKKLSAEFDKTKAAGEKEFKQLAEKFQGTVS